MYFKGILADLEVLMSFDGSRFLIVANFRKWPQEE